MNVLLSIEFLSPLLAFVAAFKGIKVAKDHGYRKSIQLLSYGLFLIAISYLVPLLGLIATYTGKDVFISVETYLDITYYFSAFITVVGFALILIAVYKFAKD